MKKLTLLNLCKEANKFSVIESTYKENSLYGVTDGKAVGTYLEHKFKNYLKSKYIFDEGNSSTGIDLPELEVDIKVTSIKQPQSSCPFKNATQKIYGLDYHLLVFIYEKNDDLKSKTSTLNILHTVFVNKSRTADYQTTTGIIQLLENSANTDDIEAFLIDKNLPLDDIGRNELAQRIINNPPEIGYLTISNALQWRLQYKRIIEKAGMVDGITNVK